MSKKKIEDNNGTEYGRLLPNAVSLPIKYHEKALIPNALLREYDRAQEFKTSDGVKVHIEYLATFNNSSGWCVAELEKVSQELYKMPFASIEAVWYRRVGLLDGWWNIVRLNKADATDAK